MNFKKSRMLTFKIVLILIFGLIVYRLYSIQIKDVYSLYGKYHRYKKNRELLPAERGLIYDRNGIALAGNLQIFKLEFHPGIFSQQLSDSLSNYHLKEKFREISDIVARSASRKSEIIFERINKFYYKNPNGFELIKDITVKEKDEILTKLKNIGVEGVYSLPQESQRVYPKQELAASLIGLCSENGAESGIEKYFDDTLTGDDGWLEVIRYGTGENRHFSQLERKNPVPGKSIYLTIDAHVQTILENNLEWGLKRSNAENAMGIIVTVDNGEILAMRGISKNWQEKSINYQHSLPIYPISWRFEPGSSLKPIVALFAMERGKVVSQDTFDCKTRRIGSREITDVEEFGKLSTKDIIVHSSNVGMSYLVDKIPDNYLYKRLVDFGFGYKTGILLGNESPGVLRRPNHWSEFSKHSLAFGQEMSTTAVQLVCAYAAIANGGKLLQPSIIEKITNYKGETERRNESTVLRHIASPTYLDTINTFLQAVVEEGHGKPAKMDYFKIAGKTGTSEKYENGKLKRGKYVAMFAGFFPADNPEIAMLILMDEPDHEHRFGSLAACPVFKKTVQELSVLPSSNLLEKVHLAESEYTVVPDCKGLPVPKAVELLEQKGIKYCFSGEGSYVEEQYPKPGFSILNKSSVQLVRTR